jgi:predicted RNA binding protein YcfA (HicA-like mRNA interferase family)
VRLPRDLSGRDLAKALGKTYGYQVNRQSGSHIRLTRDVGEEHHVTVPDHENLRVGTLGGILRSVERHLGVSREDLLRELDL